MPDDRAHDKIDPDLFEPLLTIIGTISSVGSLAIAWLQLREDKTKHRIEINKFQIKTQISYMEGQFESLFRSTREILSLFRSVEVRDGKLLSNTKLGFGLATYKFTAEEFQYYQNLLSSLNSAFSAISSSTLGFLGMMNIGRISGEDGINDNLEDIPDRLNDILFRSQNFEDAFNKVEMLRIRVSDFLRQLEYLGNNPT